MVIDYTGTVFTARCSFEERLVLRRDFWRWNPTAKRFETGDVSKAAKLREHASPAALAEIDVYENREAGKTAASRATDSDIEIPVPPGLAYLGYQRAGIAYALDRRDTLIADSPGLGKGHPLSTRILTPTGYRFCGDLMTGDQVIGSAGQPTEITAIHERGVLPTYRVTTSDGCSVVVDGDHLWRVSLGGGEWETLSTLQVMTALDAGIPEIEIPVMSAPAVGVPWLLDEDPYTAAMAFMKPQLFHDAERSSRPPRLATGSIEQRTRFLAGIVRSAGIVGGSDNHLQVQVPGGYRAWGGEIAAVVRSLGGVCHTLTDHAVHGQHLALYLPASILGTVLGRQQSWTKRFKRLRPAAPRRFIVDISPAGQERVRCLQVAAADHLYVCVHHIVTHNTVQLIGITNAIPEARSVLVICPATLKINWMREFLKWTTKGLTVGIAHKRSRQQTETVNGVKVVRKWTEKVFPDTDVVIINYESLGDYHDEIRARSWHVLGADEAHALQTPDSERTRQVLGGKRKRAWKGKKGKPAVESIRADRRVFLSGTPMTKRPADLWPIIQAFDPNGMGRDWMKYAYRYCEGHEGFHGFTADGASHLDELGEYLRSTFMVRRTKDQVLTDLPAKTRQVIELPAEGLQREIKAEADAFAAALLAFERQVGAAPEQDLDATAVAEIIDRIEAVAWDDYRSGRLVENLADVARDNAEARRRRAEAREEAAAAGASDEDLARMQAEALTALGAARKDLALAALGMRTELIRRLVDSDEKVVVFAHHTQVIEALLDAFPGAAHVSGIVPVHKRQAEVDRFQVDETCRVFVGQYRAAGVGLTLTRGRVFFAAELIWTPAELEQAEDRIHRIGQRNNVLCQYSPVAGSLDNTMLAKIIERMDIISSALDRRAA